MTHLRVSLLAAVLLIGPAAAANAQMIVGPAAGPGPGPGMGQPPPPGSSGMIVGPATGPAPGPMTGPGMTPGGSAGMPPCMQQFLPMRAEAEAKVVNYAVANQAGCGIPPDAVAQMKKNHTKTNEVRDKVCNVAQQQPKPAGPHLGEALGFGGLPTPETTRSGTGTLDTLSGNPLAR